MYITGIRFRKHSSKSVRGWRLTAGVGKLRPVVAFHGEANELVSVARAFVFALAGKRHPDLAEVWLDAADDAGDVWTIERGTRGTIFRKNNRMLSTEEAQSSLLASLLDLDASLSHSEVLVAPVELRQIITRGSDVAATVWDLNGKQSLGEVPAVAAAKELASRCAEITGHAQYGDEKRLMRIAGPSARLLGAWDELRRQAAELGGVSLEDDVRLDPGLEVIQSEIDVLNQIDQLLRRVNEGGDSLGRLSNILDACDERLIEIETKWPKETLIALMERGFSNQLVEMLVRYVSCAKFFDNLSRIKDVLDDQVRPAISSGVSVWTSYLSGTRSDGQEIESCLASMLLGVKQMAQEIDRYVSPATISAQLGAKATSTWFERLKSNSARLIEDRLRDSSPALVQQREWISRLAREVDSVKVATEYALQASQALTDKVSGASSRLQKEILTLGSIFTRVSTELERLRSEWMSAARDYGIPENIGIEHLSLLIRDASEYLIIRDTRHDLGLRVEDRRAVNAALESAVRQWWEIIGSQKSTDLSNLSFLVSEAKGALRYRDGRRQRIQKGLEDAASRLSGKASRCWVQNRKNELCREWAKLLGQAELPPLSFDGERTREVIDLAHRCAALLDVARIEEQERFAAASLWPSRLDSAVLLYRWGDEQVPAVQQASFLKSISTFTGDGIVPVILLITDLELVRSLIKLGTGSSTYVEFDSVAAIEGPRREGAIVKAELRSRKGHQIHDDTEVRPIESRANDGQASNRSDLMTRAEAALRVLNPKALR